MQLEDFTQQAQGLIFQEKYIGTDSLLHSASAEHSRVDKDCLGAPNGYLILFLIPTPDTLKAARGLLYLVPTLYIPQGIIHQSGGLPEQTPSMLLPPGDCPTLEESPAESLQMVITPFVLLEKQNLRNRI